MKNEEFYESDGLIFGDMNEWVKEKAGAEFIYKKVADLIRQGRDPEEAQKEVLEEIQGMIDGSVTSEDQAVVRSEDEKGGE